MCRAKELNEQIKKTANDLKKNHALANQELESPVCYALPVIGFILGLSLHKSLPSPAHIIAMTAKILV